MAHSGSPSDPTPTPTADLNAALEVLRAGAPGSLLVVRSPSDAGLDTLVRALLPHAPDLDLAVQPTQLAALPAGLHVLRPEPDPSGWCAAMLATLREREQRLVLWLVPEADENLDPDDGAILAAHPAVEPSEPPVAHGVAGLLAGDDAPGVEWLGGALRPALAAAHPDASVVLARADQPWDDLVAIAGADRGRWLCWTGIDGQFALRRVRWAMAAAGRAGRTVLVEPEVCSAGWWPAHAQLAAVEQARDRLAAAGAHRPGRLVALTGFEPEAIDLAEVLLSEGAEERAIEAALLEATDPGAALAHLGRSRGLFTVDDVASRLVAPPIQRAFGADPAVGALRAERFEKVGQQVLAGEEIAEDLLGSWATTTRAHLPVEALDWSTGQATAWLVEVALRQGPEGSEAWRAVSAAAVRLGDPQLGARWADRALACDGEEPISRARALYTRARAAYRLGEYADSEQGVRACLAILEEVLGPEHLEVARALHALGQALNRQERYPQALAAYNRALGIERKLLEPRHADTAVSLHAIGLVMTHLNRFEEATHAFQEALAIKEEKLGPDHPSTASTLHAIGQSLTRQGKYKEALEAFQRDLRITRKQLGKDHPTLGPSLHSIGQTYTLMGRHEYALACFAREIKILERTLGKGHPDTAQARDAMGQVLSDMGHVGMAIERFEEALAIKEQHLGAVHREVARTLYALGQAYARQGDLAEAREAFRRTVEIRRVIEGDEHPYTALAWHALGQTEARKKDWPAAIEAFDKALDIKARVLGADHPETAITRFERGRALRDSGDGGGYTEMMAATGALVHELGPEHPMVKAAKRALR